MKSCLWLERPGRWRAVGVAMVLGAALLPALPVLVESFTATGGWSLGGAYAAACRNSIVVAVAVGLTSLAMGLPLGVVSALLEFTGRRLLLVLAAVPIFVPSFLWAIGWSALATRLGPGATSLLSGFPGTIVVFSSGAAPLVLLATYAATEGLSASQVDAARLAGGLRAALAQTGRRAAPVAALAAALAGVLTLSDPGPGQILGLRTAASDILTSFSASYDYGQAGRQCLLLTALVLLLATPLAIATAPRLADEILVCQTRPRGRLLPGGLAWATCGGVLLVAAFVLAPAAGLVLPIQGGDLGRASRELARTGLNTLWYATGAGATAAAIGLGLALCVGRNGRLRMVVLGASLVMFSLPPVLTALGVAWTASHSPAWADVVLRSRLTVCVALGLRSLPVATLLGLRAWGSLPATWAAAAAIHGVSTSRYLGRVVAPCLLPSAVIAVLIVALLATADVGTVLLLHPPGEGSLPLTIFTVMANAPESLVAALCLAYVGLAVALLAVAWTVAQRGKP